MLEDAKLSEAIAVKKVVENSGAELAKLARLAGALDERFGDWLSENSDVKPPMQILQDVDLVRQKIECFARFFENLSAKVDGLETVTKKDISDGIFLGALKSALTKS